MLVHNQEATFCQRENIGFLECKRTRDNLIYKNIREWEKHRYSSMETAARKTYLDQLSSQFGDLEQQLKQIPIRAVNDNKIFRYKSDCAQLRWRINYLSKLTA